MSKRIILTVTADIENMDDVLLRFSPEFYASHPIAKADLLKELKAEVDSFYAASVEMLFPKAMRNEQ